MRIAEDEHAALVVADALQAVEVHLVIITGLHMLVLQSLGMDLQRVPHHLAPVGARHEEERMVDRRHDNDFLVGLAEEVADDPDTFHDAGYETDPFGFDVPLVMRPHPVDDRRLVVGGLHGVTQDRMFEAFLHRLNDVGQHGEIHVCHPHRLEVVTPPARKQRLVHEVAAAFAVYDSVERIHGDGY